MNVDGVGYAERTDAGEALKKVLRSVLDEGATEAIHRIGTLGGFNLTARCLRRYSGSKTIDLRIPDALVRMEFEASDLYLSAPALPAIIKLENRLHRLEKELAETKSALAQSQSEMTAAAERMDQPFEQQAQLDRLLARKTEIDMELTKLEDKAA